MRLVLADSVYTDGALDRLSPTSKPLGAGAAERERRIRREATKRRRAQELRAKLSEQSKEKRYQHALSKRQNVQQEYVRTVRKQLRRWRKQVGPAPHAVATDGVAREELPAELANHQASWDEGAGAREQTRSKPEAAMGQLTNCTGSSIDSPGSGRTVGEQSRGARWANLPPELRAIKDRWLGESSEELVPLSAADGVKIFSRAAASTPTRGDRQDQGKRPEVGVRDKEVRLEGSCALVGETIVCDEGGAEPGTAGDEEGNGSHERIGDGRGDSADGSDRNNTLSRNTTRDTPDTEGRDMPMSALPTDSDEQRDRCQHPSPIVPSTSARLGVRCSRPGCDTSSPRWGGSPKAQGSGPQEARAGGGGELAPNAALPATLGLALAPAFGGALAAQGDTHGREKARNQLRALKSRLPRSATGDIPPAVSPTHLHGEKGSSPPAREENPAGGRVWPVSTTGDQVELDAVEDAGQIHERQSRDDRAGASDGSSTGRQSQRPAAVPPRVIPHDASGEVAPASGKQQVDLVPFEIDGGAGVEGKLQDEDIALHVVAPAEGARAGRRGGNGTGETPSTTSRPSELFDSLDLSASPSSNGGVVATGPPGEAQRAPTAVTVAYRRSPPKNTTGFKPKKNTNTAAVVTTAARTPTAPPLSASQGGPADKAVESVEAIAGVPAIRLKQAESLGAPSKLLLLPEKAPESPPTAPRTTTKIKPGGQSDNKSRGAPCVSRLRAPGWGREAKITAIPPASAAVAVADAGTRRDSDAAAVPTDSALLPWDLLTPVTEAATVDEHSAVSRSTRGTARMTPASSDVSGSRPGQGDAPGAARGRLHHRSTQPLWSKPHSQGVAGGLEPPGESSGAGIGLGREKRAMWGSGGVGSGAQSAPGKSTAMPKGMSTPSGGGGGALSSQSGYRSSPLSGAGDRVGARASTFSSASEELRPGRQNGGGYVAAMGRRARSRARCEAARRMVAASLAAKRARPSTPVSERARWGKGRESHAEVERRKLLQRRAEYAEELQRKAKADAEALARRKLATTSPAMLPADPRHVRALALEHGGSPSHDAGARAGRAREGSAARAAARMNPDRTRSGASGHGRDGDDHVGHDNSSALSPAVFPTGQGHEGQGIGLEERAFGVSGGGQRGVARRRQQPERQATSDRQPTLEEDEGEEERLKASIARLDTLLREEGGGAVAKASGKASHSLGSGAGLPAELPKSDRAREIERKPVVRKPVGGIAKSRVRRGGGKETKTRGPLGVAPKDIPSPRVPAPAVSGGANEHAATDNAVVPSGPVVFPPLFSRVPPYPGERRERGRYPPPDADDLHTSRPLMEMAVSGMSASHGPGTGGYDTGHEQRLTGRIDDGSGEAIRSQYYRRFNSQQQAATIYRAPDTSSRGGGMARDDRVRRREERGERTPYSPGRHRDPRYGDGPGGLHGYSGGGHGNFGERVAAVDTRHLWDVPAERGGWAGGSYPDGRCGGGANREWDRREDGPYLPTHAARW